MAMYKPQKKHRAEHGNYCNKPTRRQVNGLMLFYANVDKAVKQLPVRKQVGVQLKLEL
jgi:hypothetical protein